MGHYASEMDPEWGKSIEKENRELKIRRVVGQIPLGEFHANALPHLHAMFFSWRDTPEDTLKYFEDRYL